jgi:anti-anti-sigma factor
LEGTTLYVYLGYELMTDNAPILQEELKNYQGQDITKIVYDATDLVYISSSGIRAIIYTFQKTGHSPKIEFVNCAQEIYDTLEIVGITNIISFVEDKSKRGHTNAKNAQLQERLSKLYRQQLDKFAANNDVVVYNMKLDQEDR